MVLSRVELVLGRYKMIIGFVEHCLGCVDAGLVRHVGGLCGLAGSQFSCGFKSFPHFLAVFEVGAHLVVRLNTRRVVTAGIHGERRVQQSLAQHAVLKILSRDAERPGGGESLNGLSKPGKHNGCFI